MPHTLFINSRVIPADLETPVGIYLKIRDLYPQSALLESSDYHTSQNSVSFIGVDPIGGFMVNNGVITLSYPDSPDTIIPVTDDIDVVDELKKYISSYSVEGDSDSSASGLFGYTAYDAVRYFERVDIQPKEACFASVPDMKYILYRFIIKVNHYKNQMTVYEHALPGTTSAIDEIVSVIHNNNVAQYSFSLISSPTSTVTDGQYMDMVRRGVAHALRGDVFQLVLSRRFAQRFKGDEFNVYRALRCVNPSPYLFYFDFGGFRIFGSSPETHCRIEGRHAYIDPIAGTTKRTGDAEQDAINARYLHDDPKENAEHVMLVDLARNDLSRNCRDVKVDFYKETQYYSHVIHLVSRVSGTLCKEADPVKTFIDTFPAGTLSGAPKVRAMQLISQLEPHNRGAYGGCIGFIGLNGSLNQAITIRTFVSRNGVLWFQAGGGIVAKSNDKYELQEVNNKLGALKKAIEMAEKM